MSVSDKGTGQGSVISPLLANIYLHYALDLWAVRWRRREATGDMVIVRYAADFIVGFQHEIDARRFLDEMRERYRMLAKLRMVKEEMRGRMHQPIAVQGKWLWYVVRGYFNYHAVPTNSRALVAFRTEIAKSWHRVLIRRGELTSLNWTRMNRLIDEWLPKPRILHPWPDKRFAVTHPR